MGILDGVQWKVLPPQEDGKLPHATHEGELWIGGKRLRCYQLNTGEAIFDASDVEEFFGGLLNHEG